MKYSVIKVQGKQYKVAQGEEILVDKLQTRQVEPEILLTVNEGKVSVGKPTVATAKITIKVLADEAGKKIDVVKYKAKSRYRKKIGFRPHYTRLLIEKIA